MNQEPIAKIDYSNNPPCWKCKAKPQLNPTVGLCEDCLHLNATSPVSQEPITDEARAVAAIFGTDYDTCHLSIRAEWNKVAERNLKRIAAETQKWKGEAEYKERLRFNADASNRQNRHMLEQVTVERDKLREELEAEERRHLKTIDHAQTLLCKTIITLQEQNERLVSALKRIAPTGNLDGSLHFTAIIAREALSQSSGTPLTERVKELEEDMKWISKHCYDKTSQIIATKALNPKPSE